MGPRAFVNLRLLETFELGQDKQCSFVSRIATS